MAAVPDVRGERHGTANVVRGRGEDAVYAFDLWYQEQTDQRPVGTGRRLT